jgi:hypothetical protein
MNSFEEEVKTVYESLARRPLTDSEVAEIALTIRQLAAFLIECGQDQELRARLALAARAAPRVINSTTQNDGEPLQGRIPARTVAPTGAPLRDSTHRSSSASSPVSAAAPSAPLVRSSSSTRPDQPS